MGEYLSQSMPSGFVIHAKSVTGLNNSIFFNSSRNTDKDLSIPKPVKVAQISNDVWIHIYLSSIEVNRTLKCLSRLCLFFKLKTTFYLL